MALFYATRQNNRKQELRVRRLMSQEVSGEHIRALRLAAGLDVAVLARRVSLSSAQLLQIESNKHSLFYSPAIRRHAAHKVWAHLSVHCGVQAQPDTPIAPAQPDPLVLAMPPSAVVLADPPAPLLDLPTQDLSDQSPSALAQPLSKVWPEPVTAEGQAPVRGSGHRSDRAGPSFWWMGLFLAAAGLAAWALMKRLPSLSVVPAAYGSVSPHASAAEPPAQGRADERPQAAVPNSHVAPKAAQDGDWVALAPSSGLLAQAPTFVSTPVPAGLAARPQATPGCPDLTLPTPSALDLPAGLAESRSLQLLSPVAQVVCVLDGAGKLQAHRLEPDQAKSIAGPAPWTVQAGSLQELQLFSGGRRLPLPADGADRVQFVEPR